MKYTFRAMSIATDWAWIKRRLAVKYMEDTKGMVAVDDKGNLVAAVIFDTWSYSSVHVHQVIEKCMVLRHRWLEEVVDHLYRTCGIHQLIGIVPEDKTRVLEFNKKIGFKETASIPDGYDVGTDTIIMTMTARECNFLECE